MPPSCPRSPASLVVSLGRVVRCFTKNIASVSLIYVNFLEKKENGIVFGNVDFSILSVFCNSDFVQTFQFLTFDN